MPSKSYTAFTKQENIEKYIEDFIQGEKLKQNMSRDLQHPTAGDLYHDGGPVHAQGGPGSVTHEVNMTAVSLLSAVEQ